MKKVKRALQNLMKPALYTYQERPIGATPGVGNYAFLPAFSYPLQSVGGAGTPFYKNWGTQPPNLYYGQEQEVIGMEGVYAPGIQSQPLIDMAQHVANLEALVAEHGDAGGVDIIPKE